MLCLWCLFDEPPFVLFLSLVITLYTALRARLATCWPQNQNLVFGTHKEKCAKKWVLRPISFSCTRSEPAGVVETGLGCHTLVSTMTSQAGLKHLLWFVMFVRFVRFVRFVPIVPAHFENVLAQSRHIQIC